MKILIIGATSAIAAATARLYATPANELYLLGRNDEHLAILAQDLRIRGAQAVHTAQFEATDYATHQQLIVDALKKLGLFDIVLFAHAVLISQSLINNDFAIAKNQIDINYTSTVSFLMLLEPIFKQQKSGTIAVLSSVAGDIGRRPTYAYASTKAALSNYLSGLRMELRKYGIHVLTIKPGFVDTPMTSNLSKNFLFASPEKIAHGIAHAILKKKEVTYLPKFWWAIITGLVHVPQKLYKHIPM